jgi:AraC-like DNA-binding protein
MGRFMRGASLSRYDEAAIQVGVDARAMLRKLGIDSRILVDPDLRLPADSVVALLDESAAASGCETFGLRLAALRRLSDYGPVSLLLAHQASMRTAIETLIRYRNMLNDALLIQVEDSSDGVVVLSEELLTNASSRQAYELAIGTMYAIFSESVGLRLKPLSVHFTHSAPADRSFHREFFGPIVEFDSDFNGFCIRRDDFDAPNPSADSALAAHAEALLSRLPYAEEDPLALEVQKAIQMLMPLDGASIVSVAGRLGMRPRTLQRRLAEEGADFSRLLNEVRREKAVHLLRDARVSMARVAELLGYSRETSFARWFTGQFGVTPSGYRLSPRLPPQPGV